MPNSSSSFAKPNLAYAKLVATPTATSWSQVYNAGNLFVCVSLTVDNQEEVSLQTIGKEVLDTLQTEFFTLENKNIDAIKDVIQKSISHVPETVSPAICLSLFKDNLLYLFISGHGRVLMKRKGKIGKLLESNEQKTKLVTASGYLQNEDTVILETKQFAADITDETLTAALDLGLPNDIAEALSPQMHTKNDGGQAAIIIVYHGVSHEEIDPLQESLETEPDSEHEENYQPSVIKHEDAPRSHYAAESDETDEEEDEGRPRKKLHIALPHLPELGFLTALKTRFRSSSFKLTHTRKLFLSITVILILLLVLSIFFTKKKQADAEQQQQFQAVYEPAKKKYEDGQALEKLNQAISYENYVEAKQLLTQNSGNFPSGSTEGKQIQELLAKVEAELAGSSPVQSVNAKEASAPANSLLAVAKANKSGRGFTQDANTVYFVTDTAVMSVNKDSGDKKEIIKNNNTWGSAVGISTYQGNFYILDREKGILKFAAAGDGYAQSSYFKQKPDVSTAKDLAIDSSVWVLLKDGAILKYTSGESDGFKAPKLEKAMSDPAKIATDADTSNVYVLDRGNSRVIKLAKEGSAHTEYSSSVIKTARDFEVKEKDKKILILSGDKVYEIAI